MKDFALSRVAFEPYIKKMALSEVPLRSHAVDRDAEGKAARLRSWAWTSDTVAWARLTVIETGAGFRVANWAAFPRFRFEGPICQAELIEVKGKLFLLVLDALYASADGRGAGTRELAELGGGLRWATPVESRPAWSEGFITPEAVWSRAGTSEALEEGVDAFHGFMKASVAWLAGDFDDQAAARSRLYRAMRRRFLDNEPSRPFMSKTFGTEWSEGYMEDFLFPAREEQLDGQISAVLGPAVC